LPDGGAQGGRTHAVGIDILAAGDDQQGRPDSLEPFVQTACRQIDEGAEQETGPKGAAGQHGNDGPDTLPGERRRTLGAQFVTGHGEARQIGAGTWVTVTVY